MRVGCEQRGWGVVMVGKQSGWGVSRGVSRAVGGEQSGWGGGGGGG